MLGGCKVGAAKNARQRESDRTVGPFKSFESKVFAKKTKPFMRTI